MRIHGDNGQITDRGQGRHALHRSTGVVACARSRAPACVPLFSSAGRSHWQSLFQSSSVTGACAVAVGTVVERARAHGRVTRYYMSYVWTGLSRAAGSNEAGQPGPPVPLPCPWQLGGKADSARSSTHMRRTDSYSYLLSVAPYECRSTGQDCPSRPASADQPDAPLCLWPFAFFDCLVSGSVSSVKQLWTLVRCMSGLLLSSTRQGSDQMMAWHAMGCMRALVLVITTNQA